MCKKIVFAQNAEKNIFIQTIKKTFLHKKICRTNFFLNKEKRHFFESDNFCLKIEIKFQTMFEFLKYKEKCYKQRSAVAVLLGDIIHPLQHPQP